MKPSGCKQVTAADVISGWNFSGPLADQIRRKNGSPVAIAQSGQDAPPPPAVFGISAESGVRLRWGEKWARGKVRGWSMRAIVKWFFRKLQDQNPKDKYSIGVCEWWTAHLP